MADQKKDDKSGNHSEKRDRRGGRVYDKQINREDRVRVVDTAPPPPREPRPSDDNRKK